MTEHADRKALRFGMANEAYRRASGLSHSEAKLIRIKTPWHLAQLREHPQERGAPSPQMQLGSATHCAVLEPEEFAKRYEVAPDLNKNSNAWKDFVSKCVENGVTAIAPDMHEKAHGMRASVMQDPEIRDVLANGDAEVSAWWTDPETGLLCKCRPDYVRDYGDSGVLLVDLKTSADASPESFSRSIATFGYHTQCDWYCDGYARASGRPVIGMLFVVVESEFPHACASYTLDEEALLHARHLNARARALYANCQKSGRWVGYGGTRTLGLPRWALKNETEEILYA